MDSKPSTQHKFNWHLASEEEVLEQLKATKNGLNEIEAAKRLEKYGYNRLPGKNPPGIIAIFISQFKNPLIYVLLLAAVISVLLHEYSDAGFIAVVLLLNATIGTLQEWKAERSAAALHKMLKISVHVKRDNKDQNIDAELLVPGDIVLLESGNRIPADLRLINTNELNIDESLLTGESMAVEKKLGVVAGETALGDRFNMAYAGSIVTAGRGIGVVVTTGHYTEVGNIARAVAVTQSSKPPLVLRMEKFASQVSVIVLIIVAVLGIIGFYQGMLMQDIFFLSVALAVSAIPEGLPVAITVALSIGTSRMARRKVIVRKLTAVEGLGSCTFIASDKTGTLTVNSQTVKRVELADGTALTISGEGYNNIGEITLADGNKPSEAIAKLAKKLAESGAICNEASLQFNDESNSWQYQGDAMDVALLAFSYKAGIEKNIGERIKILHLIPFESERKYSAVFYEKDGEIFVTAKGAVETILPLCSHTLQLSGKVDINFQDSENQANNLTSGGYRVLAVATAQLPSNTTCFSINMLNNMVLEGFAGFIDPLRPEVKDAVDKCRQAGVEVAMVTGDHPITALAIARELHIASDENQVVTGLELEKLNDPESAEFVEKVKNARVFARIAPIQKMQIVQALSKLGHFIAVTGDGVNDVPALKKAHIGIAMGSGTDLAKDTASIIVTDDNFSSIEAGIEGGRFAYDNIRKVTYLLIATGIAEILMFFLSLITGFPIPLTAVQLLWLNLVTNGIQDVALAFEGGEPETMKRKPRNPKEGIFNRLMIQQTVISGSVIGLLAFSIWAWLLNNGYSEMHARTLLFMLMVFLENMHVFNCRSEMVSAFKVPLSRNWYIVGGVILAQSLHVVASNLPFMQRLLGTDAVSIPEWFVLFAVSLIIIPAMEIFKWMKRRQML